MVNYSCEKCGKEFTQKGHYTKHLNKKNPCVVESKVKKILDKVLEEKLNKIDLLNKTNEKEIAITINNQNTIDFQNTDEKEIAINNENTIEFQNTDEKEVAINNENTIDFQNTDGINYLKTIENNTIDLILTDPPYIISRESGMNSHYNKVKYNEKNNIETVKTEKEWEEYKTINNIENDINKNNYLKYGTIYGKKYCVKTDYGDWDNDFTMEILEKFIKLYFDKLRNGGTLIIFFDLWKIETLKKILEKYNFKQIRFIEWIKTNPQPLNSKINYLTNCREIALTCIKGTKPTFNSQYDNAIYMFPLQGGKNRFHPTQKSLSLFEELIKKHSNENDTVLDTFLGGGTTLIACKNTNRKFKGCELNKEYFDKVKQILDFS
jgi:site-specific DNA-methyltransferase (adenine-specific)